MKNSSKPSKKTFFTTWFLNNQAVPGLLIMLLVFLNFLVLTKISFLFTPIISFLGIVMLPLGLSGLFYYLLKPIVDFLERKGLSRLAAISVVFSLVVAILIWSIAGVVPTIRDQLTAFIKNLPRYVFQVETQATRLLSDDRLAAIRPQLTQLLDSLSQKAISYAQTFSTSAVDWASQFASAIAKVAVAIMIAPFIIFYLLRDGDQMKGHIVQYLPTKLRHPIGRILSEVNKQFAGYVQGQVTVAIIVGIMFSIMFSLIGMPYAVTFGIMAGILNMVPYLGSFLAMVPVVILAMVDGPFMVVKTLLVFMIEQTIEGRFVTPLVLGSKLNIHPITILFILLTSGSLFGIGGVLIGIPVYASIKVIVTEIFNWYKKFSGLYEEDFVMEKDYGHD